MLLERLEKQSRLSFGKLDRFAATASLRYRVYQIPKRTGGMRTIEHPSKEIKSIQRWFISNLLKRMDVHSSATAYREGASIRENASRHASTMFTLRVDFEDFFPSFSSKNVDDFLTNYRKRMPELFDERDQIFLVKIFCRNGRLTIGAPSSPSLTNAMMYEFDLRLSNYCNDRNLIYSRYADDLFISSFQPGVLNDALDFIRIISSDFLFANLKINNEKTKFLSRQYRRTLTGLIVTSDGKISIGRDNKRRTKALVHRYELGQLDEERLGYLQGYLAFLRGSDPIFYDALLQKYGFETMNRLAKA